MREIEFLHIADIPEPPDGFSLVAGSVSYAGTALFLFVDDRKASQIFARYEDSGGASFPETRLSDGADAQFVEVAENTVTHTAMSGIDVTFPMIDKFPDGRILVAGSRAARYRDGTYDLNGMVFAPNGSRLRRILLGDGIARLACDGHGHIWVSYFDEGVYGNLGWGDADAAAPIGASGLVCFDDGGQVLWAFAANGQDGEPRYIDDCYAINVGNEEVWAYYYSDFDLCQIDDAFRCRVVGTELEGCHGMAIHGSSVLLTGQYGDDLDAGYLGTISGGRLTDIQGVRLAIHDIEPGERARFIGRGSTLNLFHRGKWLQHDMALLPV